MSNHGNITRLKVAVVRFYEENHIILVLGPENVKLLSYVKMHFSVKTSSGRIKVFLHLFRRCFMLNFFKNRSTDQQENSIV